MAYQLKNFIGFLNTDDSEYNIPLQHHKMARNVRFRGFQGNVRAENIEGTTEIIFTKPSGTNECIGAYYDGLKQRIIFFNYNSNGNHGIYKYSLTTKAVTALLVCGTNSTGDILGFSLDYPIASVNILYTTEEDGDVLHWTQRNDEAKALNLKEAENNTYGANWKEEYLTVIKAPPRMPAQVTYENDDEDNDITTNILSGSKTIDQNLFEGGIQTDYVSIESIVSGSFTLGGSNTQLIYTGSGGFIDFVLSFGFTYNFTPGTATVRITKNGTPIAGTSQNISAGFGGFTYNQSFSESLATNDIIRIEVVITDAISYPTEFFTCSGGTISASITTSNPQVSVNNLRNALFQFAYRHVYSNNTKSVWSTRSIIPLPQQDTLDFTNNDFTENSRISVSMTTGDANVYKIELAVRQIKGTPLDTEWFLVDTFNKDELSISNNDVYTYKFYNDGVYTTIDPDEIGQLQDYIQRNPRTQEMLNGNVYCLGGGTVGYNKTATDLSVETNQNSTGFFIDYCGLLFFAQINGLNSGSTGTTMKVYLYGTGTNTSGEVSTLNNAAGVYVINVVDGSGNSIGVSVSNTTVSISVATLLGNISTALQANGWTQVSLTGNILTVSFPTNATLFSSGVQYLAPGGVPDNTTLAYPFESGYKYAVQYFDFYGRTIGAETNIEALFNTPEDAGVRFSQPQLIISHRPPINASYYQILRSNNTTYSKRLTWVTVSAYSNVNNAQTDEQFAYLGISNIIYYNEKINATQGVVSYDFAQGDRVRILSRFDEDNVQTSLTIVDYEVLGTEVNPVINGLTKIGTFVKIKYPTDDINSGMRFDGTADYQHYQILLYNYTSNQSNELKPYFEFGKFFGIGNAGTVNAYHMGLNQTQSADLTTPALIDTVNGDLFYRKRNVPIGAQYSFNAGLFQSNQQYVSFQIQVPSSPVVVGSSYRLATQGVIAAGLGGASYPTNANIDNIYQNNTANTVSVRFKGTFKANADIPAGIQLIAKLTNSGGTTNTPISDIFSLPTGSTEYEFSFNGVVSVPTNNKLWVLLYLTGQTSTAPVVNIGAFNLEFEVQQTAQIEIIESSFSDVYKLITNSNGRESIVDVDAQEVENDVLVRWSLPYLQNTNINGTNNFRFTNFDEIDREKGKIQRMKVRNRQLRVFQNRGVGVYGIYGKFIRNNNGQSELVVTDEIITSNNIQYYQGDFGLGEEFCGLASSEKADYFTYPVTGSQIRLSADGMTSLSETYKGQFYLSNLLTPYNLTYVRSNGSKAKILAYFDFFEEQFVTILQGGTLGANTIENNAFSFNETRNCFSSFYDYLNPDWFICAENTTYSWKNGRMYIHDNTTNYCKFYGIQYYPSLKLVFNDQVAIKKVFNSLSYESNNVWVASDLDNFSPTAPNIDAIVTSYLNQQTNFQQSSRLKSFDFSKFEGLNVAALLRDINSESVPLNSLYEGDFLMGFWIEINFTYKGSDFSYFYLPTINYSISNKNL